MLPSSHLRKHSPPPAHRQRVDKLGWTESNSLSCPGQRPQLQHDLFSHPLGPARDKPAASSNRSQPLKNHDFHGFINQKKQQAKVWGLPRFIFSGLCWVGLKHQKTSGQWMAMGGRAVKGWRVSSWVYLGLALHAWYDTYLLTSYCFLYYYLSYKSKKSWWIQCRGYVSMFNNLNIRLWWQLLV